MANDLFILAALSQVSRKVVLRKNVSDSPVRREYGVPEERFATKRMQGGVVEESEALLSSFKRTENLLLVVNQFLVKRFLKEAQKPIASFQKPSSERSQKGFKKCCHI